VVRSTDPQGRIFGFLDRYISMLDILFVYINVIRSTLNKIRNTGIYEAKRFCYDISFKPFLCYDKLCIFGLAQRRFVGCQQTLAVP
jgi:hypothetical protein